MSICEQCGCYPWIARNADHYRERLDQLHGEYTRQAATHAVESAEWRLKELQHANDHKGFQRKIAEQRRTINRLEAKVRKLGAPPYAPEPEVTE